MPSRKAYEAVATIGEYTDRNGEKKKRYLNCGTVFIDDATGKMSLKLDCLPLGKDWSGYIAFYPPKDQEDRQKMRGGEAHAPQPKADDEHDEIPF